MRWQRWRLEIIRQHRQRPDRHPCQRSRPVHHFWRSGHRRPLLGATVTVVDGKGVQQGSTRTNTSDGSYSVTLNNAHIPLPLLIQATGVDMTGIPVTLHSVVQTSTTGATRGTANISPITEAVVAMLLGADPATQFQSASSLAST